MQQAIIYAGSLIGIMWGGLTVFAGIRSLLLGQQQNQFRDIADE